tara:strand:+ start:326 stop:1762 length:1437 start_codon:yes stop_codon:yes gene_type:complete
MQTKVIATTLSVKVLAGYQGDGKIYLDEAFQSNARWGTSQKQDYLQSVIEGRATSAITIAKIKDLLSTLEDLNQKEKEDYKTFCELMMKGYEYITIDGNNRSRTLLAYLLDEFPLKEIVYDTGDVGFKGTKDNKYYSQLTPELKEYLNNIKINIHIVKQSDRKGLSELFSSINSGISLNDQEKRNAIFSLMGNEVRGCVRDNLKGFEKMYTSSQINRRFPDEFVVTISNFVAHGLININKGVRDDAYGDNTPELRSFKRTKRIVKQICNLVAKYGEGGLKVGGKFKSNVIDLALLLRYMDANKIVIEDDKAFYNWFAQSQAERIDDPTVLWDNAKRDHFGNLIVDQEGNPVKPATDNRAWIGIQKNLQRNFLVIREEKLVQSLADCPNKVVTFRDTDRSFNPQLRRQLWIKQDGRCALTDTKIPFIDVYDGKKTHVDHEKPWSKGGATVESNAQLTLASANRQKSDKIAEELPSFDEV